MQHRSVWMAALRRDMHVCPASCCCYFCCRRQQAAAGAALPAPRYHSFSLAGQAGLQSASLHLPASATDSPAMRRWCAGSQAGAQAAAERQNLLLRLREDDVEYFDLKVSNRAARALAGS